MKLTMRQELSHKRYYTFAIVNLFHLIACPVNTIIANLYFLFDFYIGSYFWISSDFVTKSISKYHLIFMHCIYEGVIIWVVHFLVDIMESRDILRNKNEIFRHQENLILAFNYTGIKFLIKIYEK